MSTNACLKFGKHTGWLLSQDQTRDSRAESDWLHDIFVDIHQEVVGDVGVPTQDGRMMKDESLDAGWKIARHLI